ncbi:hypothetical protein CDES_10795 [Corynebacterium deserti GIMN1.010]|uniref:N-acetyltransferase domain-containing protein n=1 Tax=Corynebacterium deserti GIMN1.010 TaxID=931089 RepID=A0A0M4CJJ2_9CORY|nr:GNAT family N-acetyltransferase [Corynebacterium deserti]ALC06534.1 hypothetical protein CDES_10795 [Corynebacterium deserti GIMN1.010]
MTLQDKHNAEVVVSENTDKDQFEISYPGEDQPAGITAYIDTENSRIFYHTVVGEEYGGRGLASILVKAALDTTKEAGLLIVPVCSFVKGYVEKNGVDGTRTPTRDDLVLVKEKL